MALLTFDDGPGPSTEALLDVLAAAGVRATFFLLGANLARRMDVGRRIAREGHVLGNHTYSHARVITAAALVDEIARTDALIAEATGAGRTDARAAEATAGARAQPPLRLPYGTVGDDPRLPVIAGLGRVHVGWTAAFGDWERCDPAELAARMRGYGEDAVLDLHDSSKTGAARPWTVEAVRLFTRG